MKSPWEILQSPVGSGGIFSLLSSNNIPESLGEIGVEYIEVRKTRYIDYIWAGSQVNTYECCDCLHCWSSLKHIFFSHSIDCLCFFFQVCSTNPGYAGANPLLLGFVNSWKSDVGIQIFKGRKDFDEGFDIIFSTSFMKKLTKQINKLQFYATPKQNLHVELVDKEWVDVPPSSPNSYELGCTIYSSLKASSFEKLCIMEVTE